MASITLSPPTSRWRWIAAVAALIGLARGWIAPSDLRAAERPIGDTKLFATIPYPGHPGGIAVDGGTVYVDTFNLFDRPLDGYDAIFAYDLATGALRTDRPNPIRIPRMMPVAIMGLAGIALDAEGRLYVADMNGRVVRVDPLTGAQDDYAMFPINTGLAVTSMPGAGVFDDRGNLYVTETAGVPVIWRVPPGGGEAELWFFDLRLAGVWGAGQTGITIDPAHQFLYLTVGSGAAGSGLRNTVYRLPIDDPHPSRLEVFHRYELGSGFMGGLAFGRSGKLYVVSLLSGVSILGPDGTEETRFPKGFLAAALGRDQYSCPVFAAFDGSGSLLVTSLGCVGLVGDQNPKSWKVLNAWVNDTAAPLPRPAIDP